MESIRKLFNVGNGPSSSHTIGPKRAALEFLERNKTAARFTVTLHGSLALTGKGHLTDTAILSVLEPVAPTEIVWETKILLPFHTNGMKYESFDSKGEIMESWIIYSTGGGTIENEDTVPDTVEQVYDMSTMTEIMNYCVETGRTYWEYVEEREGSDIMEYLDYIWEVMSNSVNDGLDAAGVLPGGLGVRRKATEYFTKSQGYVETIRHRGQINAYALAVSEMNASGGIIATSPTCGSSEIGRAHV